MSGIKCPICERAISPSDTVVRVVAEIAKRDPNKDGKDAAYFSDVLDWESFTMMHLTCARDMVWNGKDMPYGEEIGELCLFEKEFDESKSAPVLKLVQGNR